MNSGGIWLFADEIEWLGIRIPRDVPSSARVVFFGTYESNFDSQDVVDYDKREIKKNYILNLEWNRRCNKNKITLSINENQADMIYNYLEDKYEQQR